jgi:hypothetical protein
MIPILLAVALTAAFRPAQPTVGDVVTIDFPRPVTIDASSDYEVVSQHGARVAIRTFVPHAITIRGHAGAEPFAMRMPVRSVLKQNDPMQPAPLAPPRAVPYPRMPFVIIGIVALLGAVAWAALFALSRRRARERIVEPPLAPAERFRRDVAAARSWAELADAVRAYLAATDPDLSPDLTTAELLARMRSADVLVRTDVASGRDVRSPQSIAAILHQGDLEKFSPWGAEPADFQAFVQRALEVAA